MEEYLGGIEDRSLRSKLVHGPARAEPVAGAHWLSVTLVVWEIVEEGGAALVECWSQQSDVALVIFMIIIIEWKRITMVSSTQIYRTLLSFTALLPLLTPIKSIIFIVKLAYRYFGDSCT